jgi:hypothetical protein
MIVSVSDDAGRRLNLSPQQIALFQPELSRVLALPGEPREKDKVGPDCALAVTDDAGATSQYQILGGIVLLSAADQLTRPFYFGLLVLQWLELVPGRATVPVLSYRVRPLKGEEEQRYDPLQR